MKTIFISILSSLIFLAFFLNHDLKNLNKPLRDDSDLFSHYFILENNMTKLSNGDFGKLFYSRMYYPKQLTLGYFGDGLIPLAILAWPFYLVSKDPLTSANLMIFLTLTLSFL